MFSLHTNILPVKPCLHVVSPITSQVEIGENPAWIRWFVNLADKDGLTALHHAANRTTFFEPPTKIKKEHKFNEQMEIQFQAITGMASASPFCMRRANFMCMSPVAILFLPSYEAFDEVRR